MSNIYIPKDQLLVDPQTGAINFGWLAFLKTLSSRIVSVAWSTLNFTGSSLADLAVRSASDLSSGTVPLARLSGITTSQLSASAGITETQLATHTKAGWYGGTTPGTGIAAGLTVYLSPRGAHATESSTAVVFPIASVLKRVRVVADGSPGAGKSFTYTLRVNGIDQAVTATMADAATTASDLTHSVTVAAGDTVSVKLVTSAGASTREHAVSLDVTT